jgi:hypothetical protein
VVTKLLKLEDKNLYRMTDLKEKIKEMIVKFRDNRKSESIIFGDIDIVSTLSHWNLSGNSQTHVGEFRLAVIINQLNKEGFNIKTLCLLIDDEQTIKNDKKRYGWGGGDFFDFAIFGSYGSKEEIDNNYKRIRQVVQKIISESTKNTKAKATKPDINYSTEVLIGKMKAAIEINPIYIQRCLEINGNNSIEYMRLMDFLREQKISLDDWRNKRMNWFEEGSVLHFGDVYKDRDESFCLPNGVSSQVIQFWRDKSGRILDLNTLNLLYFTFGEYVKKIQYRALELKKEVTVKPIEEIILKYL